MSEVSDAEFAKRAIHLRRGHEVVQFFSNRLRGRELLHGKRRVLQLTRVSLNKHVHDLIM